MIYSRLEPTQIIRGKTLRIDTPTVFLAVPDSNIIDIYAAISNSGILLSNCEAIISPMKIWSIGRKRFNSKANYYNLKKLIITDKSISKKLKVLTTIGLANDARKDKTTLREEREESKFFFYDCSIISQAMSYIFKTYNEKMAINILLEQLNDIYKNIKSQDPIKNIDLLFFINDKNSILSQVFGQLRTLLMNKKFQENLTLFDNYALVSNMNEMIIPIFNKNKGLIELIKPNLNRLNVLYNQEEESKEISKEGSVINNTQEEIKNSNVIERPISSVFTKIADDLKSQPLQSHIDPETDKIKIEIDTKKLSKVLKSYKISDPDIVSNVKSALDTYISHVGNRPTRDTAETLALKAINYSVHGTDEIPDLYKSNPNILINKLQQIDIYKTKLNLPKNDHLINPKDIIDIDYTTGQFRQKFEFGEMIDKNVRKLFESCQSSSSGNISGALENPIKVLKINKEIKDDDQNRFINYKITLQNLAGGTKEPYEVELKVPGIVNERYFKLRGNLYIIASQQFLRPITKTDKNEVRLIGNYGVVRVSIQNLKFNPTDVDETINYIRIKYPNLIKEYKQDYVVFNDNSIVNLLGNNLYQKDDYKVFIDPEDNKIKDSNNNIIGLGKFEYLYQTILNKVSAVNPQDKLTKTKKSIPYLQIYLLKCRIPLIYYLWSQKGLLTTLNDFGVNYQIVNSAASPNNNSVYLSMEDGKSLKITPKSLKEELLVNGLLYHKLKQPIKDFENEEEIKDIIAQMYTPNVVRNFRLITENHIDPITKELLQFEGLPTNLPGLISTRVMDKLLNEPIESLADLKIYRSRMSEIIMNIMYSQIKRAHSFYQGKVLEGRPDAKLEIVSDFIIDDMLGRAETIGGKKVNTSAGVLENCNPVNPIEEIMLASRVIKSGRGGIREKRSFKAEHRNIHPSQYGNISANMTPESSTVGLITHHTMTPLITNEFGAYGTKDITNASGWRILGLNEALIPFQNQMLSDRLTMGALHSKQITPVYNTEPPLVQTGAEYVVPQLASTRFVQKAKKDGVITEVDPKQTMTISYNDGTSEVLDIQPRLSRTKRGSYLILDIDSLKQDEKVNANQIVAFSKNFSKDGIYCAGKNINIAVLSYLGNTFEDAYVLSQDIADQTYTDIIKECRIIVDPSTTVLSIEKEIGKVVKTGDVLLEFTHEEDLDNYLDKHYLEQLGDEDSEVINLYSQGNNTIKLLAIDGEIVDIKVFINNKNSADKKLLNLHNEIATRHKKIIAKLTKDVADPDKRLSAIDNMDLSFLKTGNNKFKGNLFEGVMVVYYIKEKKPLRVGDKIATRHGAKGVVGHLLKEKPKGEFTPEIDAFIAPAGVVGRQNVALLKELYIGKIYKNLNKKVIDMANDNKIQISTITKMILDVYNLVCSKEGKDSITRKIESMNEKTLRSDMKNGKFKLYCIIKPFDVVDFSKIKAAADVINIPLDEKVFIPELNMWSDPVPVGTCYFQFLEHFSDVYSSVRGSEKYLSLTGGVTKGKRNQGGMSIGNLDVFALLTYDIPNVRNELLSARADQHKSKRAMYNQIISSGGTTLASSIIESESGGTYDIMKTYMTGLGLNLS